MSSKSGGAKKKRNETDRLITANRKARYNYTIESEVETGLVLTGTEVKSLREGKSNLEQAYAGEKEGELFLYNAYIAEYEKGNRFNHRPRRARKLLLHRRELNRLIMATRRQGMTLAPLRLYFNEKGRVKLMLGLARGKKMQDKREREKERSWQRDKARLMRAKRL
ncbi:MAG: SsrA-binding protein SmpB [Parvularculales bacterium]